jgi:hypothetical protein
METGPYGPVFFYGNERPNLPESSARTEAIRVPVHGYAGFAAHGIVPEWVVLTPHVTAATDARGPAINRPVKEEN